MYTHAVIAISHMILSTVIAALAAAVVFVTPHHKSMSADWAHQVITKAIEIGPFVWLTIVLVAFAIAVTNITSNRAVKEVSFKVPPVNNLSKTKSDTPWPRK